MIDLYKSIDLAILKWPKEDLEHSGLSWLGITGAYCN